VSSPLGPGGRPFRGWRALPFLLAVGALGANALILLSDRAPGLLSRIARRIDVGVARAAGAAGVDVSRGDVPVPRSDFDVHVLIWGVAALLAGLAAWSWASLFLAEGAVFLASVALEAAQDVYSTSRSVQLSDLMGNAVGVLAGTGAVVAFALLWRITHVRSGRGAYSGRST
jgi:hypothetical protein